MTDQDLYDVLGLDRDATNFQVRAAHAYLLGRVDAGEIPLGLRPAIEQAYETLSDPDLRQRYDLQPVVELVVRQPPSPPVRSPKPAYGHGLARVSMIAAAVAMLAGIGVGVSLMLVPGHGRHAAHTPVSSPVTSAVSVPAAAPQIEASAPPAADESAPEPAAPSPEPEEAIDADAGAPPPSAPAPVSRPVVTSAPAYRAPAAVQQVPQPRQARTVSTPQEAEPSVPTAQADFAAPDESVEAPVETVEAAPSAAPSSPTLVQSSIYGRSDYNRSNVAFRVAGRYCQDTAGGQIFIPVGAPVSPDLSC